MLEEHKHLFCLLYNWRKSLYNFTLCTTFLALYLSFFQLEPCFFVTIPLQLHIFFSFIEIQIKIEVIQSVYRFLKTVQFSTQCNFKQTLWLLNVVIKIQLSIVKGSCYPIKSDLAYHHNHIVLNMFCTFLLTEQDFLLKSFFLP